MISALIPLAAMLARSAVAQSDSNTPPYNASATNPWWPQYPDGRSVVDYMLSDNASEADLTGQSDVAKWLIEASSVPVTWNETSARAAQNHTNTCLWEHWGHDNLAMQYGSDPTMRFDVRSMTAMWAEEWDYYPFSHPELEAYSHFTAMTWNASTTVGCGWNVNCQNQTEWPSKTFFVCNYWPPPNVVTNPPGMLFAANIRNFTGWPVDEAKLSSINALAGSAGPTPSQPGVIAGPATATPTAGNAAAATNTSGNHNNAACSLAAPIVGVAAGVIGAVSCVLLSYPI